VAEAFLWGLVGTSSLVVGALIAILVPVGTRTLALVMAFGAGVLISAVAFELTDEAFRHGGGDAVAGGLVAGALVFYLLDSLIDRARVRRPRHRGSNPDSEAMGRTLVLGATLDGIPESAVIGMSLLEPNAGVSVALVVAVFLSNVPESIAGTTDFIKAGHSRLGVVRTWSLVALASALAAAAGYGALGDASDDLVALTEAFAAGALLTMLCDSLIPESFDKGGRFVGVVTVVGFATAFLLSTI
jgi:ZIP family zinc transporter